MLFGLLLYHCFDAGHIVQHARDLESVIDLLAPLLVLHNTCLLEHRQMLGDRRDIGVDILGQLADALFTVLELLRHPQPGWMPQGL